MSLKNKFLFLAVLVLVVAVSSTRSTPLSFKERFQKQAKLPKLPVTSAQNSRSSGTLPQTLKSEKPVSPGTTSPSKVQSLPSGSKRGSVTYHRQTLLNQKSGRGNVGRGTGRIGRIVGSKFPNPAPPSPAGMALLKEHLSQILPTLHKDAAYDPKLNTGIFQRGAFEPYCRFFPDCVHDFIGDGDYSSSNAHNNMGFSDPPGNCGPHNTGRLTWFIQCSAIPRNQVINTTTGLDLWPAEVIIDSKSLRAFNTTSGKFVPNPQGWPRLPVENSTNWQQQLVNRTMPFGSKFDRNGKAIHPPRAFTNRKVPLVEWENGAKDEFVEYWMALDYAVSLGFEVVMPIFNPCDYCPFLWDEPHQPTFWGDRGATSVLTQGRAISFSHFMNYNFVPRQNDRRHPFDYQTVEYLDQLLLDGHSAGPAAQIWNMVGEASAGYAPDPLFAKAYVAWKDPAVELVRKESFALLNFIGFILRSSTGNGGASEDFSIELLKWYNMNQVAGMFWWVPGMYHQQIQLSDCGLSVLVQLFDLESLIHYSSWMQNPTWYLDTCNADESTWKVNPTRKLLDMQTLHQMWFYQYSRFAIAWGLLPRDDPGFEGVYVAPGRSNADAYLRYILRTTEQRRVRDTLFPGKFLVMNQLDKSGNVTLVSTLPKTVNPANSVDNYATQLEINHDQWEHVYGYLSSASTSGDSYINDFGSMASGQYDPNLYPRLPGVITNPNATAWLSPGIVNANGKKARHYVEPSLQELYADPRSGCTPSWC